MIVTKRGSGSGGRGGVGRAGGGGAGKLRERPYRRADGRHCGVRQNRVDPTPVAGVKSGGGVSSPTGPGRRFPPGDGD